MEQSQTLLKMKQRIEMVMSREYLSRSTYLLYRINDKLEIPLESLMKENSLQDIAQNYNQFIQALKICNNCVYDEQKKVVIPQIKPLKNQIIVSQVKNQDQFNLKYLSQQKGGFLSFVDQSQFRLIFQNEKDTEEIFQILQKNELDLKLTIEEENLYINLLETSKLSSAEYLNNNFQFLQMQYMMSMMAQQNQVYNKNFYVRKNSAQQNDFRFDQQNFINRKTSCNVDPFHQQMQHHRFSLDETKEKQKVRLSTNNFPFLPQNQVQQKITQFYLNREILKIYNNLKGQIKPAQSLSINTDVLVVEINDEKKLEHLEPTRIQFRKDSNPTPKQKALK